MVSLPLQSGTRAVAKVALLKTALLCVTAFLSLQAALASEDTDALAKLRQVLSKQRSVSYMRIETRPGRGGNGEWKLKVQTVAGKGIKATIITPIMRNDIVSIDDGRVLKTFLRDRDILSVQPSPYLMQPTVEWRMKLVAQNYKVRMGGSDTIAGQRVRELIIEPNLSQIPTRRMYVDTVHDVVLKYVIGADDSTGVVLFDTKSVDFDPLAAIDDFGLPEEASDADVVRHEGPRKFSKPDESRDAVGFSARLPDRLPLGFKISGSYLFTERNRSYVMVKISDGMTSLTVYQWRNRQQPTNEIRLKGEDAYGVSCGITSVPGEQIAESTLRKILDGFLKPGD